MAIIESIRGEFVRYKALAEAAMAQVAEPDLSREPAADGNSIATVSWHVSGNLQSRFTDFLTTDGEKPWRKRDEEFDARRVTRQELLDKWEAGWRVLLATLAELNDDQLGRTITIRGQALRVDEALHRSLAHTAYHCGQMRRRLAVVEHPAREVRGSQQESIDPAGGRARPRVARRTVN
jgi:hypothetical protein